jgi:hypothetical protein
MERGRKGPCPGTKGIEITNHALMRARQRFSLKNKRVAKSILKEALNKGTIISSDNNFNFTVKHGQFYLLVKNGTLGTVITEEMYRCL